MRRWLDRLQHSGGVPTTWLQVILSIQAPRRASAHPVSLLISHLTKGTCAPPPFRLGQTLLSDGLDITTVPRFRVGSGPIILDDVSCTGKEPGLLLCNKREWLHHDCTHHEDVNIACTPERNGESLPTSKSLTIL